MNRADPIDRAASVMVLLRALHHETQRREARTFIGRAWHAFQRRVAVLQYERLTR